MQRTAGRKKRRWAILKPKRGERVVVSIESGDITIRATEDCKVKVRLPEGARAFVEKAVDATPPDKR